MGASKRIRRKIKNEENTTSGHCITDWTHSLQMFGKITGAVKGAAQAVGDGASSVGSAAGGAVSGVSGAAGNVVGGAGNLVGDVTTGATKLGGDAVGGVGGFAGNAVGGVSKFAGDTVGGAAKLTGDGLGAVGLESAGVTLPRSALLCVGCVPDLPETPPGHHSHLLWGE